MKKNQKRTHYADFIGEEISISIEPFQYRSASEALRAALTCHIKAELAYFNGLLCTFSNIRTTVDNCVINVYGRVKQCEVDC